MRTKMRIKGYRAGRIPRACGVVGQSPTVLKETGSKGKISE